MLRSNLILPCAIGALAVGSLTFGTSTVAQKDSNIAMLKTQVEYLETELERIAGVLDKQASAGAALESALTESEAAGFLAGINPDSRKVLLSGLRKQAEAMQSGASDDADAKKDGKDAKKGTKRGRGRGK